MPVYTFTVASVISGGDARHRRRAVAGEALEAGDFIYLNRDAWPIVRARKAVNTSTAAAAVVGICLNSCVSGQWVEYTHNAVVTVQESCFPDAGRVLMISNVAGRCMESSDVLIDAGSPGYVTLVGVSLSRKTFQVLLEETEALNGNLWPSNEFIITAGGNLSNYNGGPGSYPVAGNPSHLARMAHAFSTNAYGSGVTELYMPTGDPEGNQVAGMYASLISGFDPAEVDVHPERGFTVTDLPQLGPELAAGRPLLDLFNPETVDPFIEWIFERNSGLLHTLPRGVYLQFDNCTIDYSFGNPAGTSAAPTGYLDQDWSTAQEALMHKITRRAHSLGRLTAVNLGHSVALELVLPRFRSNYVADMITDGAPISSLGDPATLHAYVLSQMAAWAGGGRQFARNVLPEGAEGVDHELMLLGLVLMCRAPESPAGDSLFLMPVSDPSTWWFWDITRKLGRAQGLFEIVSQLRFRREYAAGMLEVNLNAGQRWLRLDGVSLQTWAAGVP